MNDVDIAVLTAKPEEFTAFLRYLQQAVQWPGTREQPNQYGWVVGELTSSTGDGTYKVVLGLTLEQTNVPSALAALATFKVFRPRYLVFMGIAGSLDASISKGDVLIADYVRAFQYGRISETGRFQPRQQFQEPTDQALRVNAAILNSTTSWRTRAGVKPDGSGYPALHFGGLASGDVVLENVAVDFFKPVLESDSWLRAIEMESAGLALAVRHLREAGAVTGLMVVRGISDMPVQGASVADGSNTTTRRHWTDYAAHAAAVFLEQFITCSFPYRPSVERISSPVDPDAFSSYRSHFVQADDLPLIHAINEETFRASDLVPASTLEAWWQVNPFTLRLITTFGGQPAGYWHILPLKAEIFRAIAQGELKEREIRPDDIFAYPELPAGSAYIYIGAITADAKRHACSAAVILDLIAFLDFLHHKIGIAGICAQAVSPQAIPLMAKFGMTRLHDNGVAPIWGLTTSSRIDNAVRLARRELQRLRGLVPDAPRREQQMLLQS